ncbi:MAG: hypothetical protein KDA75_05455 [Planctomycetaceae bacterium]|nr:hypothetical protein [Planctomycetaceae bacterium]
MSDSARLLLAALIVLTSCVVEPLRGDDIAATAESTQPESQVLVVPVRTVPAIEVEKLVRELFDGVQIEADVRTNSLFVNGTSKQLQAIEQVLQVVDQAENPLSFTVHLAHIEQTISGDDAAAADFQWPDVDPDAVFHGQQILTGEVTRRDLHVQAIEGQQCHVQIGGTQAVQESRMGDPRGGFRTAYHQEPTGSILQVTAARRSSKVLLELSYESTQLGESGNADVPTRKETLVINSTLSVNPGKAVLAGSMQTSTTGAAGTSRSRTLLIVRAEKVD